MADKSAETRRRIMEAAAAVFRERGYGVATLEEIADEMGITRSAVLYHFPTKEALLVEIVAPVMASLDEVLDEFTEVGPLTTPRQRRRFLTALVQQIAAHRAVAALLSRDLTAHAHLGPDLQITDRAYRLVGLLRVDDDDEAQSLVRGLACLGVILRPLVAPDDIVDFDDPATQALLVDGALAVLRVKPSRRRPSR